MSHTLNKRCFDKEGLSVKGQSPLANRSGVGGGGGGQVSKFEQVWGPGAGTGLTQVYKFEHGDLPVNGQNDIITD